MSEAPGRHLAPTHSLESLSVRRRRQLDGEHLNALDDLRDRLANFRISRPFRRPDGHVTLPIDGDQDAIVATHNHSDTVAMLFHET